MVGDDDTLMALARTFVELAGHEPFFRHDYHTAAEVLAPLLASRVDHPNELLALACIEALSWTGKRGQPHLAVLEQLRDRHDRGARGHRAAQAIERISNPPPPFRPNAG